MKCINTAKEFEHKTIADSPDSQEYANRMKMKNEEAQARRQAQVNQMQQHGAFAGMPMNANAANFNTATDNNMGGMNVPNGGMVMPNGQMGPNVGQQNPAFPAHLQRQMQPTPLPPQQQQQQNLMDPSAFQQPQMPNAMQANGPPNPMMSQALNQGLPGQASAPQIPNEDIMHMAKQMYDRVPEMQRNQVRLKILSTLPPEQVEQMSSQRGDPIMMRFFALRARDTLLKQRMGQQQSNGNMQMGGNPNAGPMQQSGQMGGNIDFSSIMGQQATALKLQESGEQVVPASNNPSFNLAGAGQVNMPQNINPQMLGQPGGTPQQPQGNGSNDLNNRMQHLKMQQEHQQRIQRQNAQNAMAQQQATAQAAQLRGQPGGLNAPNALNGGPVGQINSPNFAMLNKPMVPPGQSDPSTPQQQKRQQGGPPGTPQVNSVNQLQQHHQQMLSQNQSGNPQAQLHQAQLQQKLLQEVPQQYRDRLQHMPPQQIHDVLTRLQAQRLQAAAGMGAQPNMQVGGQAQQQQLPAQINFMPPNMGPAVPGFSAQPPPPNQLAQQPPPQMSQMDALNLKQRSEQQQQQLKQRAADWWPFPRAVLANLGMSVPQNVQLWGQLRQHIIRNQTVLPGDMVQKVQAMQNQWFETHPEDVHKSVMQLRARLAAQPQQAGLQQPGGQQNAPQSAGGLPPRGVPNGQPAPPAQMVPPTAPMQQTPVQHPQQMPPQQGVQGQPPRQITNPQPPTQQEINDVRQRNPVQTQGMTDDQLRQTMWKKKVETNARQAQNQQMLLQQQALRQQQLQRAQPGAGQQQFNGQERVMQNQPSQPRGPPQQVQQTSQVNGSVQVQGQKRQQPPAQSPASDEVMEIPNPNAQQTQMGAAQAPPMQRSQSQQRRQGPQENQKLLGASAVEQINRLPEPARTEAMERLKRQMDALRRANQMNDVQQQQQPNGQQPNAQQQQQPAQHNNNAGLTNGQARVQALWNEVGPSVRVKGPAIKLDANSVEQAQVSLKKLWEPLRRVDATFIPFLNAGYDLERIKNMMRFKILVQQNAADEHGNIKDYLALTPQQLHQMLLVTNRYYSDMKIVKEQMDANQSRQLGQGQQARVQAQAPAPPQQQPARPGNGMAKAQQHTSAQQVPQLSKTPHQPAHIRKVSSSSKAPPAPTENKSFDWGPPTSTPDGVPKYEPGRSALTPDKLKFPPQKKRRTGQSDSPASTPAAQQSGTPGTTVSASPGVPGITATVAKVPGKSQQQIKEEVEEKQQQQQQKRYKCRDLWCEANIKGYETEEELKEHTDSEHGHVEDPLAFLLESAAGACDVDKDGKPLPAKKDLVAPKPRPRPGPMNAAKKQGQTPNVKQEVATPPSQGKPGAVAKVPAQATEVAAPEKTLREALEDKIGFEHATGESTTVAPPQAAADSEDGLWQEVVRSTLQSVDVLDDWTMLGQVHSDWGLRPEGVDSDGFSELTPSDASASSRDSDVSQTERMKINFEWDPFGNGDTYVPEFLQMQTLGIGDAADTAMPDAADKNGKGKTGDNEEADKPADDEWNWSNDDLVNWDPTYGPNAGLEDGDLDLSKDPFGLNAF